MKKITFILLLCLAVNTWAIGDRELGALIGAGAVVLIGSMVQNHGEHTYVEPQPYRTYPVYREYRYDYPVYRETYYVPYPPRYEHRYDRYDRYDYRFRR